jgi:adenylate kinase family enzyme
MIIVGPTGSGKTTLAEDIAACCQIPYIELDNLFWKADWQETPDEEFISKIRTALHNAGDSWVIDGNYSRIQPIIFPLADTVVWLDYPLRVSFSRLVKRTFRRVFTREQLWSGNRESAKVAFFSKESLLYYALKTYGRRKARYVRLMMSDQYLHLRFIRLCHPREAVRLLDYLQR